MVALGLLQLPGYILAIFIILAVWEIIWKGIGLWRAGRNNQLAWFVVILIINTVGILPIIYLAFFQRRNIPQRAPSAENKRR